MSNRLVLVCFSHSIVGTKLAGNVKFKTKQLVTVYARRMQIEETFRDIKRLQQGMGLRHSHSCFGYCSSGIYMGAPIANEVKRENDL